jgi:hypothetical protein
MKAVTGLRLDEVCPKCGGRRWYPYDANHGKPCEVCCQHDQGWWQLAGDGYGDDRGKWACKAGCGEMRTHQER